MNKFLYLFLFFCSSVFYAQDTAAVTLKNRKFIGQHLIIDTDTISKVKFNDNFKNKFKNDAFVYDSQLNKKNAFDRFVEWLQEKLAKLFNFGVNETSVNIIGLVLKTIAILIVIFVVYLIVKSVLNKEGQWIFGKNSDRNIINYDDIERNLTTANFENLIEQSLKNGQNRLTVRYYYLWLLKIMSEREMILWDLEKTNSDYVYEIKDNTMKQEFIYLSYLYNHIWYGEFDLTNNAFEKSKTAFESAIQKLMR